MPAFTAAAVPHFTLYGDGTVIFRNPMARAAAGRGLGLQDEPAPDRQAQRGADPGAAALALGEGGLAVARPEYRTTWSRTPRRRSSRSTPAGSRRPSRSTRWASRPEGGRRPGPGRVQAAGRSADRLRPGRHDRDRRLRARGVPRRPVRSRRRRGPRHPRLAVARRHPGRLQARRRPERQPVPAPHDDDRGGRPARHHGLRGRVPEPRPDRPRRQDVHVQLRGRCSRARPSRSLATAGGVTGVGAAFDRRARRCGRMVASPGRSDRRRPTSRNRSRSGRPAVRRLLPLEDVPDDAGSRHPRSRSTSGTRRRRRSWPRR